MKINFKKMNGLVPAIVQDSNSGKVLMLAYMNKKAYEKTRKEKLVTFFSRSRQKLWTKGETSGNYLYLDEIREDCDGDALLIKARPAGPVCHTGKDTCFNENNQSGNSFLYTLEKIINRRKIRPQADSYTNRLLDKGIKRMAQKVAEEAAADIAHEDPGRWPVPIQETHAGRGDQ